MSHSTSAVVLAVVVCGLYVTVVAAGDGRRCYVCRETKTDPTVNTTGYGIAKEGCIQEESKFDNCTVCFQLITKSQQRSSHDTKIVEFKKHSRSCLHTTPDDITSDYCKTSGTGSGESRKCYCFGELCNHGNGVVGSTMLMVAAVFTFVYHHV